jgi:hypothetical protein
MPVMLLQLQRATHAPETGGDTVWVRRALAFLIIVRLSLFYLLHEFRGLVTSQAMKPPRHRGLFRPGGFLTFLFVLCG